MLLKKYNSIFETEHYSFHYEENSVAAKEIESIASTQEMCYGEITNQLKIKPEFKINYYLMDSPEEVGGVYSQIHNEDDFEPCNAFTEYPNTIYCVYNDKIKCVGMHEDTHIISYSIFRPKSAFLREGLAMFMDKVWKGRKNEKCVIEFLDKNPLPDIYKLFDNDFFFAIDCDVSYPLSGAFVGFLIENFGIDVFLAELYYTKKDYCLQLDKITHWEKQSLQTKFIEYIKDLMPNWWS